MAPNDTPDPTTEAIQGILREEAASSPNMDADTLAGRIAAALPASQAADSDAQKALDRANERIAELTAACARHVDKIHELGGDPDTDTDANPDGTPKHNAGPEGDVQQTGAGQTDKADGSAPAVGGLEEK